MSNNTNNAPHGVNEPLPTITTGNRNFLCSASIVQYHGEQSEKEVRGQEIDKPLNTIDTRNRYALSGAFLSKYYSGENQAGAAVKEPLPTVTAIDHNALVAVNISSRFGNGEDGRGRSVEEPLPTVTGEDHNQLMGSYLVKYYSGEEQFQSVKEPLHTITTKPRFYLVAPHIVTLRNNMIGQTVGEPLTTITAKEHHAVVSAYLTKVTGREENLGYWSEIREMLNKYAGYEIGEDEILIIEVDKVQYFISDISMRMLEPRELAKAQGFPEDYVLQVTDSYSKAAQIARIGNSVCPVMSEVLVRANLPELCGRRIKNMAQLNKVLTA
jgi:DNA (cytosine-5)-methyltransferase 1